MISKQALSLLPLLTTMHNGVVSAREFRQGTLFKSENTERGKSSAKASKNSIDSEPLNTRTDYPEEYLKEIYWHPEIENFEIIDWNKWEDMCGHFFKGPGKVYDPPQRSMPTAFRSLDDDEMIWCQRSVLHFPEDWPTSSKPNVGMISDDSLDLLARILGPHPDSSSVPKPLRNILFWMEDNEVSETLVSFNRGAWRESTPEGRSVGLTLMETDWTTSQNKKGKFLADITENGFINWQVSPDGKYIKLARMFAGAPLNDKVYWADMYIVQEGDKFTDGDGNVLHDVKPGDIVRYDFKADDPYDCKVENYSFQYLARKVATLDEDTGKIKPYYPHFERLQSYVAAHPPGELCIETHGFTDATSMSQEERWDFYVKHLSTYQQYSSAPTPPHGDELEFD